MELPPYVDVGQHDLVLPAGIHPATLEEIRAALVDTSPQYRRRVDLWSSYLQFRAIIHGLVKVDHEYLDGSFVTSRPAPKDVDLSFWVDAAALDALTPQQQTAWAQVWSMRISHFKCDAYLVSPCDPGHPAYDDYLHWKQSTEEGWPAYKNRAKVIVPGVAKGYIEVQS